MTADTPSREEMLALADFIPQEANGPGKFTTMRFTHEKWLMIAAALRLAAKRDDEVFRDAFQECADIATRYNDCGGDFIAEKIRDAATTRSIPPSRDAAEGGGDDLPAGVEHPINYRKAFARATPPKPAPDAMRELASELQDYFIKEYYGPDTKALIRRTIAALSASVPSADGPINTEQLDQLQFGRTLHKRPFLYGADETDQIASVIAALKGTEEQDVDFCIRHPADHEQFRNHIRSFRNQIITAAAGEMYERSNPPAVAALAALAKKINGYVDAIRLGATNEGVTFAILRDVAAFYSAPPVRIGEQQILEQARLRYSGHGRFQRVFAEGAGWGLNNRFAAPPVKADREAIAEIAEALESLSGDVHENSPTTSGLIDDQVEKLRALPVQPGAGESPQGSGDDHG